MQVQVNDISYDYMQSATDRVTALSGVSFVIEEKDFLGIAGAAGCGKTTLLQLLAGLYAPISGQILLNGEDINGAGYDKSTLRRSVGIVFQYPEYQLFETTVEKDVAFTLKRSGLGKKKRQRESDGHWKRWALTTKR